MAKKTEQYRWWWCDVRAVNVTGINFISSSLLNIACNIVICFFYVVHSCLPFLAIILSEYLWDCEIFRCCQVVNDTKMWNSYFLMFCEKKNFLIFQTWHKIFKKSSNCIYFSKLKLTEISHQEIKFNPSRSNVKHNRDLKLPVLGWIFHNFILLWIELWM